MSKGSRVRPHNKAQYDAEFDRIFGTKKCRDKKRRLEISDEQKKCTPCEKQERGECPGPTPS